MRASPARRGVLSFCAFDLSHPRDSDQLRSLTALGNDLIMGCVTDRLAQHLGLPINSCYTQRRTLLEHCRYVDRVVALHSLAQIRSDIVNYNASVFAVDDTWQGQFDGLEDIAQVVYLPRSHRMAAPSRHNMSSLRHLQLAV